MLESLLPQVFNAAIGKMVTAVLWVSPLGIASLIAASICRTCNLASTLAALGWWVLAVLLGLTLQVSFQNLYANPTHAKSCVQTLDRTLDKVELVLAALENFNRFDISLLIY